MAAYRNCLEVRGVLVRQPARNAQVMGEEEPDSEKLSLVEEQLGVGKRTVERGRIIVRKHVETRDALAEATLHHEEVRVERVPMGVRVATAPAVREEDGVLVVPVLEERLVVSTELVLKEELRITKWRHAEQVREPGRRRSENAEGARGRPP